MGSGGMGDISEAIWKPSQVTAFESHSVDSNLLLPQPEECRDYRRAPPDYGILLLPHGITFKINGLNKELPNTLN